jgi:hypothetical protein
MVLRSDWLRNFAVWYQQEAEGREVVVGLVITAFSLAAQLTPAASAAASGAAGEREGAARHRHGRGEEEAQAQAQGER